MPSLTLTRLFCDGRVNGGGIHRVAVVLGGDVHPVVCQILHRMIAASVTIFQFVCLCPIGKSHKLVSQTDGKDGDICLVELFDLPDDLRAGLRSPGRWRA